MTWLTGKYSQSEIDGTATGRSFRRKIAWCWDLQPSIGPAETIYHAILVDGIWVGSWCLLIALSDTGRILAWQWCARESTAAWTALFEQIPAPGILVSDGGSGLPTALHTCWPETKHQRCLFYLQMNVSRHLTRNPRTDAGRALRGLVMQLSEVWDEDAAIAWQLRLDQWWQAFGHLTRECTLFRNGQFGFTHDRLRKAWHLVRGLVRRELLRVRRQDLRADDFAVIVQVTGPNEREVPVLASWERPLRVASWAGNPDQWAFMPGRTYRHGNLTSLFVSLSNNPPQLSTRRMHATWIVHHLNRGTPMVALLAAAGLQSIEGFDRYLRFVNDWPKADLTQTLR